MARVLFGALTPPLVAPGSDSAALNAAIVAWLAAPAASSTLELEAHFAKRQPLLRGAPANRLAQPYEAFDGVARVLQRHGFVPGPPTTTLHATTRSGVRVSWHDPAPVFADEAVAVQRVLAGDAVAVRKRNVCAAEFTDYGWSVCLRDEAPISAATDATFAAELRAWAPDAYRLMHRTSFVDATRLPGVRFDVSAVFATPRTAASATAAAAAAAAAALLDAATGRAAVEPHFEVEVELLRDAFTDTASVRAALLTAVRIVLCGLQGGASIPVALSVAASALDWVRGALGYSAPLRAHPGPLAATLTQDDVDAWRLRAPDTVGAMAVTDKADGERALLVWPPGAPAPIVFDGTLVARTTAPTVGAVRGPLTRGVVLDGELVGETFYVFDAYVVGGVNVTTLPLLVATDAQNVGVDTDADNGVYDVDTSGADPANRGVEGGVVYPSRLASARAAVAAITAQWAAAFDVRAGYRMARRAAAAAKREGPAPLGLVVKRFATGADKAPARSPLGVAAALVSLLRRDPDARPYATDGVIFTPTAAGVHPFLGGRHWPGLFKWKPPEHSTVDFLVLFEGPPVVSIATRLAKQPAVNATQPADQGVLDADGQLQPQQLQLQNVTLWVSGTRHRGADVLQRALLTGNADVNSGERARTQFTPLDPPDATAGTAALRLGVDGVARTARGEAVLANTVVEFGWHADNGWVPLRMRYDKTHRWRTRAPGPVMNAAATADAVWSALHAPVALLEGGDHPSHHGVQPAPASYYAPDNPVSAAATACVRAFHSFVVKGCALLTPALSSHASPCVLDLATGKAQDAARWAGAGAGAVLGVDISADSLFGATDCAAARVLRLQARWQQRPLAQNMLPPVVLARADAAQPLRDGSAGVTPLDKSVLRALLLEAPDAAVRDTLAEFRGVAAARAALAATGGRFAVATVFFALHYFAESNATLDALLRNVASLLPPGGALLITVLDGDAVYAALRGANRGAALVCRGSDTREYVVMEPEVAAAAVMQCTDEAGGWAITKEYDDVDDADDDVDNKKHSVDDNRKQRMGGLPCGLRVHVRFHRIAAPEWLVSQSTLLAAAAVAGLVPARDLPPASIKAVSRGTGRFEELLPLARERLNGYDVDADRAAHPGPWRYSALHRYFAFRRTATAVEEGAAAPALTVLQPAVAPLWISDTATAKRARPREDASSN